MTDEAESIAFADYASDMRELSVSATGTVAAMRQKQDELLRCIAAIVAASSGGKIAVPDDVMGDADQLELVVEYDSANRVRVFRTRRRPK